MEHTVDDKRWDCYEKIAATTSCTYFTLSTLWETTSSLSLAEAILYSSLSVAVSIFNTNFYVGSPICYHFCSFSYFFIGYFCAYYSFSFSFQFEEVESMDGGVKVLTLLTLYDFIPLSTKKSIKTIFCYIFLMHNNDYIALDVSSSSSSSSLPLDNPECWNNAKSKKLPIWEPWDGSLYLEFDSSKTNLNIFWLMM